MKGSIAPPQDLVRQVFKLTNGKMADVVFEHVGPVLFEAALKSLAFGGKLITCGATSGPTTPLDLRYVFSRQLQILGAKMGSLSEMREVSTLISQRKLKAVIDRVFNLKEAAKAHEHLAAQNQFGKVILEIS